MHTLIWGCSFVVPINKSTWVPFLFRYAILSHDLTLFQWNSARSGGWWKARHLAHSALYYVTNGITFSFNFLSGETDFLFILDLTFFYSFTLKSESLTLQKNLCYLLHRNPFKSDEICFLFHLESFFRSQDIKVIVLTFWSCRKNGLIRKIRLISKFMTSQPGLKAIAIHILPNISQSKGNQTII